MKENTENQFWKTLAEMEVGELFYCHMIGAVKYLGFANNRHYYADNSSLNMKFEIGRMDFERTKKYLMHNQYEEDIINSVLNKKNTSSLYGIKNLENELKKALQKEDFEYAEILRIGIDALKSARK